MWNSLVRLDRLSIGFSISPTLPTLPTLVYCAMVVSFGSDWTVTIMSVVLCSCGTSAAKRMPRSPRFDADRVAEMGGVEAAAEQVYASFADCSMDDELALSRDLSAEIHSLARLEVGASDTVILFGSETADGQACALAVRRYLLAARPGIVCTVEVIPGLQVYDAERFRREGVRNFVQAVLKHIEQNGARQCVLNPTGGFKGLVPYTVLIGMIKGVEAKYIFEQSKTLIALPPVPVEFARERIEPLRPLLERIDAESAVARADFESLVPFDQRETLEPLFEDLGDGQLSFSPFGFLVWDEIAQPTSLLPYLSRPALDDLVRVRAIEGTKPEPFIRRVAASPGQLEAAGHIHCGDGFKWLKPGQHTRDRYLTSHEGSRLLVWRIVDKPEYGEFLQRDRERPGATARQLTQDRRTKFEPFVRLELYET